MEVPSISGSLKRPRAPANITQPAHCLVDGCSADLSLCRDYHRRHKVCETHSKSPMVTIGGREQRFCQQCSRFHSLVEFDEGKRSCRKRLDGHNRRRRKPQPDSLYRSSSSSGLIFSTQQPSSVPAGSRLVSFTNTPQVLPSAAGSSPSSSWPGGVVKSEMLLYNNDQKHLNYIDTQNSFPEHNSYKGVVVNQLHSFGSQEMYSDGLNEVVDSNRALSLLSSATPPVTREFGLNHMSPHALAHHNMHYCGLGQSPLAQESNKPFVSATEPHMNDTSAPNYGEMFQHGPQGSSTSGPHQTLTFMWE